MQKHLTRILEMLSRGEKISPVDISALSNTLAKYERTMDLVEKWVKPGTTYPNFDYVKIKEFGAPTLQAGAVIWRTSNQSITAPANVDFTSVHRDTHGFADLTANNDRLTIPPGMDGLYLCGLSASCTYASAISWVLRWNNGTDISLAIVNGGSTNDDRFSLVGMAEMSPGDFIYSRCLSGASTLLGAATVPLTLWLTRVAVKHAGKTVR